MNITTNPATRSAAIYVRRSHRDAEGSHRNGRSLSEQEMECRELALRQGLDVVEIFAEREGTGASARSRKARPQWDAAMKALREGDRFRTLIVWALDRADRRGATAIGELLNEHENGSRRVLGVDGTDTADSQMRMMTIIRAEMAREESERTARRVERTKRADRAAGKWLGGRPPYGLKVIDFKVEPDEETYLAARRIAEEALAGRTLWEIVRGLNEDKIPTPTQARPRASNPELQPMEPRGWGVPTVSQLLRSPAFAGLQSIRRRTESGGWQAVAEVFHDESGVPVSIGRGVITPEERYTILRQLGSRTRAVQSPTGRRPVTSLLSEIVRCAVCGRSASASGPNNGYRSYRCAAYAEGRSCEGFTAPMAAVDDVVSLMFLKRLAALEAEDALLEAIALRWTAMTSPTSQKEVERARRALDEKEAALGRLQDLAVGGVLTAEEASRRALVLRAEVDTARAMLDRMKPVAADLSPLMNLVISRPAWESLELTRKREIVRLGIDRVEVTRSAGRGRRFVPAERMRIVWADGVAVEPPEGI